MVELKSKQSAQDSLRHSLRGIPALFWAEFDGKLLAEIFDELDDNTKDYKHRTLELSRNRTKRDLIHFDKSPTRARFLATWLSQGRDYIGDWVRGILRERDLGGIALWYARQSSPPSRGESDAAWQAWVESITATLWPTDQELQRALSPTHLAFRELILGVEVVEVTSDCIRWHIPSTDINNEREVAQNALGLNNLFEQRGLRAASHNSVAHEKGSATTPASGELRKRVTSAVTMGGKDRLKAQNEPQRRNQQQQGAIAKTWPSVFPVHGSQAPAQRQFFRTASLAPPSVTAYQQTPSLSSECTRTLLASSAHHPGSHIFQPAPEPTGAQSSVGVSTSGFIPAHVPTAPGRPRPFPLKIPDSALRFCSSEILRDAQNTIRDLARELDNLNKLAGKARHLLDTTLAERNELNAQERGILRTKFSLTFHDDLPVGSGTREAVTEAEMQNDRLCVQLRQKLAECNERKRLLESEKQRTESMREQAMKIYVKFVNELIREGILERRR